MATLQKPPALYKTWSPLNSRQVLSFGRSGIACRRRYISLLTVVSAHTETVSPPIDGVTGRRQVLVGAGAFATSIFSRNISLAVEVPSGYQVYSDLLDGYSLIYPSIWRDYTFRGMDVAFKDVRKAMENVRVGFVPTDKKDVHDLGPSNEVASTLVKKVLSARTQKTKIFNVKERTTNGKNYYTFDYSVSSPTYSRRALVTIAVGNGKYYTFEVGTLERRWKSMEDIMQTIADSFTVFDV